MSRLKRIQSHVAKTRLRPGVHPLEKSQVTGEQRLSHGIVQRSLADPGRLTPTDLIALQRTIGNAAVLRMLAPQTVQTAASAPVIRRQVRTGSPGDVYEREANRTARQVIGRLRSLPAQTAHVATSRWAKTPDERKTQTQAPSMPMLHRRAARPSAAARQGEDISPRIVASIQAARSGGRPLGAATRSSMEQAFGADFGAVRIHNSAQADALSRSVNARAFTTGQDVFFRKGEYRPDTQIGKGLLAHELTHVVQQQQDAGPASRSPEERLPHTAHSAAAAAAFGQPLEIVERSQTGRIHRSDEDDDAKKASTGPTGDTGRTTSMPTAPLSPEQNHAVELIDSSGLSRGYKARAAYLIKNPDAIDQTAFGICGLVAILRAVVKSNPVRFAQMTMQALADTEITSKWLPVFDSKANAVQKRSGAQLEFLVSQWLIRKAPTKDVSQKVLTRDSGTGRVAETTKNKQYSTVFAGQKAFSDEFKIDDWENKGSFATTTGGLNYLLGSLGTGKESFKINVTNFGEDYKLAKDKAGPKGSVIASVTDVNFYQKRGAAVDAPLVKDTGAPKYRHWVMIDAVKDVGQYYVLDIWTWGKHFPAKVNKGVIESYIPSLLAA